MKPSRGFLFVSSCKTENLGCFGCTMRLRKDFEINDSRKPRTEKRSTRKIDLSAR